MTFAPGRAVAMLLAIDSVFSTFRPIIQALAPRWTSARTWALQIVPPPPVQKTTLLSVQKEAVSRCRWGWDCEGPAENAIFPDIGKIVGFRKCHGFAIRELQRWEA